MELIYEDFISNKFHNSTVVTESYILIMSTDNNKIIDHQRLRYPCCILWSPLPPITWILPFIGHTGIADQNGVIYDFAGPYTIGRVNMAFGPPTRYLKLDPNSCTLTDW